MCRSVARVVDSKDSLTLSVSASPASTALSSLHALLGRNSRNGGTGGNILKSWVIPLFWDLIGSTLPQPSKDLHISTPFGMISLTRLQRGLGLAVEGLWSVGIAPKARGC